MRKGLATLFYRLMSEGFFSFRVGKQLHRLDVGVAVDDPPGDLGPGVRERFRSQPDARNKIPQKRRIGDQPDDQWQGQPKIGIGQKDYRAEDIERGIGERVESLKRRFPNRRGGLHDAVGDATRKILLKPADRLAQHAPVRPPPHQGPDIRHQRLIDEGDVDQTDDRPDGDDENGDQSQFQPVAFENGRRSGLRQQVHNAPAVPDQADFHRRDHCGEQNDQSRDAPERPQIDGEKRPEPPRRRGVGVVVLIGIDEAFKEAKHGIGPVSKKDCQMENRAGAARSCERRFSVAVGSSA